MPIHPPASSPSRASAEAAGPVRLLSLDAFRGLVIIVMFWVNVGGNHAAFKLGSWAPERAQNWLGHVGWNGSRMGNGLADYVFPWFLFIVGASIPFSMTSGRGRDQLRWRTLLIALRRGVVIYLLGSLMWAASIGYRPSDPSSKWHGPIDWTVLLHWDILPLIGFGYVLAVALWFTPRWVQVASVAAILAFKWFSMHGPLVAPAPEGVVVTGWRDILRLNLGWNGCFRSWGWWGTLITQGLAFGSVVLIGSLLGNLVRERVNRSSIAANDEKSRAGRLLGAYGAGLVAMSVVAWQLLDMPFSKDYCSPSYVLVTCGSAASLLAAMFWVIDVRRWTTMTPLRVFGANALAAYILAEFLWKAAWMQWQVALPSSFGPNASSSMITALFAWCTWLLGGTLGAWVAVAAYIGLYGLVLWGLWRNKWFIKV
jgi:predicted acyltransferase